MRLEVSRIFNCLYYVSFSILSILDREDYVIYQNEIHICNTKVVHILYSSQKVL